MLLELHAHTAEHSACSHIDAVDLVRQVAERHLQGVVLTDHHYLWPEEELADLRRRAGVPGHFLVLSGQEVRSKELGDVVLVGATRSLDAGTSLREIRELFPAAAVILAHPYRDGKRPRDARLSHPLIHAVEIFSSNHSVRDNSRGLSDWHRLRFVAVGGTDTHGSGYAGVYPTQLDHPVSSAAELAAEIRAGRCRPFFKEIPHAGANALVTEVTIGTKGPQEERPRLVIRRFQERAEWRQARRAFKVMSAVADAGFAEGPFRVPRPLDGDPASMTLIEQGIRGKSLHDKLVAVPRDEGRELVEMAATWLARLHGLGLRVTPVDELRDKETRRIERYVRRFAETGSPHAARVADIAAEVRCREAEILDRGPETLVQGHGDFHPKNVIVGQDLSDDRSTAFISAIDFESSYCQPRAFDVGCFVAQVRSQLSGRKDLLEAYPDSLFVGAYRREAGALPESFEADVEVFRARTNLSIAAYLVKLGLGEGPDVYRVIVEAEAALSKGCLDPAP